MRPKYAENGLTNQWTATSLKTVSARHTISTFKSVCIMFESCVHYFQNSQLLQLTTDCSNSADLFEFTAKKNIKCSDKEKVLSVKTSSQESKSKINHILLCRINQYFLSYRPNIHQILHNSQIELHQC